MRWVVDAMNVIGSKPDKWWNDPDKAMRKMAGTLAEFALRTGEEITVVFDRRPREFPDVDGIEVVFASRRGRNAADYEIEQIVKNSEDPRSLRVVTSDRRLIEKVRDAGAKVTSSGTFRRRLESETAL